MNMFVRPDRLYGLQAGGSAYRDRITTGGRDYGEWITAAHIVWTKETPEIIAEFANVRHDSLYSSGSGNQQPGLLYSGRRIVCRCSTNDGSHTTGSNTFTSRVQTSCFSRSPIWLAPRPGCVMTLQVSPRSSSNTGTSAERQDSPRINGGFLQTSFPRSEGDKMSRLKIILIACLLLSVSFAPLLLHAAPADIAVVVNRDVPLDNIPFTELRKIASGRSPILVIECSRDAAHSRSSGA